MPRTYNCKKCHTVHSPPTGKACQRAANAQHEQQEGEPNAAMMEILMAIQGQVSEVQGQVSEMDGRMRQIEDERQQDASVEEDQEVQITQNTGRHTTDGGAQALTTPSSVRSDIRLMARAAERLNRLSLSDLDGDDDIDITGNRAKGKKSGSLIMASEVVKKQIDWPHLHVKRMVNGRRRPIAYADLRPEEFAFGFIEMLNVPASKWDYMGMIEVLRMVLQDTIDFSWSNALGFYEAVGLEVEYGSLTWDEVDRINKMRTVYSRTVFPGNRDQKDAPKTGNKTSAGATKTCALYQRGACEHQRDHHPFLHACSYCQRTCNAVYRHSEADCQRKVTDDTKNAKRRE